MAPRKRKAPEKSRGADAPGLILRIVSAAGRVVARHPLPVGGVGGFAVVFSFVSANALWYQPSGHPSPFFRTRDAAHSSALAGFTRDRTFDDPAQTTTFRIERVDPDAAAAPAGQGVALRSGTGGGGEIVSQEEAAQPMPQTKIAAVPAERPRVDVSSSAGPDPVASAIRASEKVIVTRTRAEQAAVAEPATTGSVVNFELVKQIQRGLANIAYTDVRVDGVAGEQTRSAIRHFEKHYRLPETGEPNDMVLKKLKAIGAL